jgi:dihydrodipicolinate synthase/N-acetylneuraminate lyase
MSDTTQVTSPPEGLIIELVTPLTPSGSLDRDGLRTLVARVLPAADGLFLAGPLTGEGLFLPDTVRRDLICQAFLLVAGRLPLLLGITGHTAEETHSWAQTVRQEMDLRKYQGPVFLVDLPLWYHSNRGLPRFYTALLKEVKLPLILLNLPKLVGQQAVFFKHRNLRTQVVKKLAALPSVVGLIYQGDMRRFLNYHLAAVARPSFAFYEADEVRFLTRPGAWGVVSPGAQLCPETWRRVTRACLHPDEVGEDISKRHELWEESTRLLQLAGLYRAAPAALMKGALAAHGLIASDTTAPGTPLPPPPQKQKLLELPAFPLEP